MNTTLTRRYQIVEIPIPNGATNTSFSIPDQPNLRNALIHEIEIFPATVITATPVNQGAPLAVADLQRGSLTLTIGTSNDIQQVPLVRLQKFQASTTPFIREPFLLDGLIVSWDKCTVNFTQAPGTTNVFICLGVYYTLQGDQNWNGYNALQAR